MLSGFKLPAGSGLLSFGYWVKVNPMNADDSPAAGRQFNFGVVILGAGASSRMGKPKLLLPWGKTSVLGHLIAQWQALNAKQIAVVHAAGDQAIGAELDRRDFPVANRIANLQPERGMFSSVQCSARWDGWQTELSHWAIVLGDQPHLRHETLHAILKFAAVHRQQICQPSWRGRPRHPVIVPKAAFEQLKESQEEDLKKFLTALPSGVALCDLDDPGLDRDLDTPADYRQARHIHQENAS